MSFTVQEVAQLIKQAKENGKPYVFFTGAGCSISAGVPSATGLIEEIRSRYPIQVKNIDHAKDQYNYGKYMSVLDKDERRRLLKPHIIDNKKINWAHIALACLMQSGYIQRVLTFNFDSILSRACNMLGLHPSIYDFATANPHLYHLINDPSIVHLHGQGAGFVQLNTGAETEKHTAKLGEFIAATLNSNPSLFIGYSGNADAFFPLLEEKYSEQHRLIWTGIKTNIDEIEADSVKNFIKKNNNLTHYIGNTYADDFLIQLAKELDCFPPQLFLNPYIFLEKQLQDIQPYPLDDGLDMLSNLSKYLKRRSKNSLINILYTSFIHKYPSKESTQHLAADEIDDVMWAYDKQAWLLKQSEKNEQCFSLYKQALQIHPHHIGCLHNYALALSKHGHEKVDKSFILEAIYQYEQALNLEPKDNDLLYNFANAYTYLAHLEQSEHLFEQAWIIYKQSIDIESENPNTHAGYANSLMAHAKIFNEVESYKKAKFHLEKSLNLESDDFENLFKYAFLLQQLGNILKDKNTYKECFFILDKIMEKYPDESDIAILYSNALSQYACLNNNDESLFDKALEKLMFAISKNPNVTYELACHYSLRNNLELAKDYLLQSENNNTLPQNPYDHLANDSDLNNIHNESWFIELLERLKAKEESLDKAS